MYVSTYLELNTTLLGWKLFDLMYLLIVETGIFLVPFVIMISRFISQPQSTMETGDPRIAHFIESVLTILIFIVCVVPMHTLQPTMVKFQPTAKFGNLSPGEVDANSDPSTYKDVFASANVTSAKVPIFWALIQTGSSGTAHAIASTLPQVGDLKQLKMAFASDNIQEPTTRAQYNSFYSNCYVPARNKHFTLNSQNKLPPQAIVALEKYGSSELDWPGSRIFMETPGLYARCTNPDVCGSTLDSRQAIDQSNQRVSCGEWWNQLRPKILADSNIESSMIQDVKLYFDMDTQEIEDTQIKNMLENYRTDNIARKDEYGSQSFFGRAFDNAQNLLALPSIANEAFDRDTKYGVMKQVAPMIKAVLLMFFTIFLPFLLVLSNYQISSIITITVIFFSLHLMHGIFAVANWLDIAITEMVASGYGVTDYITSPIDVGGARLLLGIVLGALFFAAPTLWFYSLMMVGQQAGQGLSSSAASIGTDPNSAAGKSGGGSNANIARGVGWAAKSATQKVQSWSKKK